MQHSWVVLSMCLMRIHLVYPYRKSDTTTARKKSLFILSQRSDWMLKGSLGKFIISEFHNTPQTLFKWGIVTWTLITEEMYYGLIFLLLNNTRTIHNESTRTLYYKSKFNCINTEMTWSPKEHFKRLCTEVVQCGWRSLQWKLRVFNIWQIREYRNVERKHSYIRHAIIHYTTRIHWGSEAYIRVIRKHLFQGIIKVKKDLTLPCHVFPWQPHLVAICRTLRKTWEVMTFCVISCQTAEPHW